MSLFAERVPKALLELPKRTHLFNFKPGIFTPSIEDYRGPPRGYPVSPVARFVAALSLVSSYQMSLFLLSKIKLYVDLFILNAVWHCRKLLRFS